MAALSMVSGFIKMNRTPEALELIRVDPKAFALLSLIALRAQWSDRQNFHNLAPCEALVGDHESAGLTRQEQRTRLARLVKWGFLTTQTTNKGTVARLIDTRVFEVYCESATSKSTRTQPATNQQSTTTKKDKKAKQERNGISAPIGAGDIGFTPVKRDLDNQAESIYEAYPRKIAKPEAIRAIRKALTKHTFEFLIDCVKSYAKARFGEDSKFTPYPATWFNREQFNDDPKTWKAESQTPARQSNIVPKQPPRPSTLFPDGPPPGVKVNEW